MDEGDGDLRGRHGAQNVPGQRKDGERKRGPDGTDRWVEDSVLEGGNGGFQRREYGGQIDQDQAPQDNERELNECKGDGHGKSV